MSTQDLSLGKGKNAVNVNLTGFKGGTGKKHF